MPSTPLNRCAIVRPLRRCGLPASMVAARLNLHSARAAPPVPHFPRFRALALFGRRPPHRVDSLVMPASENLHNTGFEFEHKLKFGQGLNWIANGNFRKQAAVRRATSLGGSLLRYYVPGRGRRLRRGLRDRERQPGVPARRPVGGVELAIALQAEKCLVVPNRKNISKLRADAENARAEAAEHRRLAEVIGDLLVGIADEADEHLLRQEVRHAPVEMEIDAALLLRVRILEIVGKA